MSAVQTLTIDEYRSLIRWLGSRQILVYLLLLILGLVLENAGLGLLIPLINAIEDGSRIKMSFGVISIDAEVNTLIALVMSIVALRVSVTLTMLWFGSRLTNTWNERMQVQLHDALHNPAVIEPRTLKSGELINTIVGETWSASEYCRAHLEIVSRVFALAAYGAVLAWLSWKMTAVLFLSALPLAFAAYRFNRRLRGISRTMLDLHSDLYQATVGSVGAQFTIAAYGLERRFNELFAEKSAWLRAQQVKSEFYGSIVPQLLSLLVVPLVVGLGLYARSQSMPIGEVVIFVLVLYRALPQASGVLGGLTELARHHAGFQTVTHRLKSWVSIPDGKARRALSDIEQIELKQISFAYGSASVLTDFSAELSAGQTYRLHGTSGAGKSTIVSLLFGVLAPSAGVIDVNGIPLDDLDLADLRRHIGYAGQRTSIFEASIQDNIELWRDLDSDRVRVVEEVLGVSDISSALPDGRMTRIGTGGVAISGGQLQRVAIARAIAGAPSFIILDEATSELDLESERKVMAAVHKLCPRAIVLIISHRVESENEGRKLWIEPYQ